MQGSGTSHHLFPSCVVKALQGQIHKGQAGILGELGGDGLLGLGKGGMPVSNAEEFPWSIRTDRFTECSKFVLDRF